MAIEQLRTIQIGNDWFGERQGGLNRVYSELLKHLPEVGVQVKGLVVGTGRVESETNGVIRAFAPADSSFAMRLYHARRSVHRILREERPDLIASHFAPYAFAIADKLRSIPTVIHFHGPWAGEVGVERPASLASRVQATVEQTVYPKARRIIVLSSAFQKELFERYGVSEDLVRIVPGGVDSSVFHDHISRAEARYRLNWPSDRPILLAVRRQVRRMGLENLIDAMLQIRKQVPEVLTLLGGTGPIQNELRARIAAHGLEENVRQLGRIEETDLPTAYRAADLTIVPTQKLEGFGMITLESLACGTPVLVTPVGGLPEVIRPFAPECIFNDTSSETMAEVISAFLRGTSQLPSDAACRAYAIENFSWPVIAQKTREVYEEALA